MSEANFNVNLTGESTDWTNWRNVSPYRVARSLYNGNDLIGGDKPAIVPNASELYFKTRVALTPFAPWYRLYIDAMVGPLYEVEPPVYEVSNNMVGFVDNCNRAGMSVDEYKQDVSTYSYMDAVTFLASSYDGDPAQYPVIHYFTAQQLNMTLSVVDKYGKITKHVFTIARVDKEENEYFEHNTYEELEGGGTMYQEYKSEDYEALGDTVGESSNSHPIWPIYSQRREQGVVLPIPKNQQVAGLCIDVYNSESDQRWVLRVQGHSVFVISSDTVPDGIGDGLSQVLHLDSTETQGGAEFVSPPAELSKEQRESKQELVSQLFEVMRHGGVIASKQSQIPESGASKAYTFAPVNAAMGKTRNMAIIIDDFIVSTMEFYTSQSIVWDVKYKTDFTPSSPIDVIDLVSILNEFKVVDATEAQLAVLKQFAMLVTGDNSLADELDAVNFDIVKEVDVEVVA